MRWIWIEAMRDAWREFSLRRGRNLFAFIGIFIGTSAVISILQIGSISRTALLQEFEKSGTDIIRATIVSETGGETPSVEDILKIPENNLGVMEVSVEIKINGKIKIGHNIIDADVIAVNECYYNISSIEPNNGRLTYDIDKYSLYAVVGDTAKRRIEEKTGKKLDLGDKFEFNGKYFTVIGTLKPVNELNIFGVQSKYMIFIPLPVARRLSTLTRPSRIMVRLEAGQDDQTVAETLRTWIQAKAPKATVITQTAQETIELIDKQVRIFGLLLVGIGLISLLVSGVGIMNVMMMSVLEKRREIGLRRAVGATRGTIIWFFLCNAFLLCLSGTLGGVVFGIGTGYLFSLLSGLSFVLAPAAIPLAVGMAVSLSFFFGLYPAFKAARLDIVMALRSK